MLNKQELEELLFFADKVATVHGAEHSEFIEVNKIINNLDSNLILPNQISRLKTLTNNFTIPKGACKAQTRLLNILGKLNEKKIN